MIKQMKKEREKTRVEKRVESLPASELLPWVEQALYGIGRNLAHWQKNRDKESLEEARLGAEVLHTILESLSKRVS